MRSEELGIRNLPSFAWRGKWWVVMSDEWYVALRAKTPFGSCGTTSPNSLRFGGRSHSPHEEAPPELENCWGSCCEATEGAAKQSFAVPWQSSSDKREAACSTLFSSAVSENNSLRIGLEGTSLVRRIEGLASAARFAIIVPLPPPISRGQISFSALRCAPRALLLGLPPRRTACKRATGGQRVAELSRSD